MAKHSHLVWFFAGVCLFAATFATARVQAEDSPQTESAPADQAPKEAPEQAPEEAPDQPADQPANELLAGHSQHGEAFNEGPRQAAYIMGTTGPVHFPVTTQKPEVQKFVDQGVGQLHGFWYFEAERSFRQAAMLDPDCAIAYWGMAMANTNNNDRAKKFLEEAKSRRSLATEREAMYIDALDDQLNGAGGGKEKAQRQVEAFEALVARYPDDLEAKAWLGYTLYKNRGSVGKKHEDVEKALKEVLAIEPLHPVHHYNIHLWDAKDAKNALESAAKCGEGSPGIAHMWHMPGHIYSRLKRYEDAVWQQEASARTDHSHMMRDRVLPDEIHNFAHNNEWLIRNLIYVGRWQDAVDLAKNMIELPQHPKYNTLDKRRSTYYGRVRLLESLEFYEQWADIIAYTDSSYLEPTEKEDEQIRRLHYRGVAFAHLHHVDKVNETLADLQTRLDEHKQKEAEEKRKFDDEVAKAKAEGKKAPDKKKYAGADSIRDLEKAIADIDGSLLVEYGDYKEALPLLTKGGASKSILARVQFQAGEKEKALKVIADEVKSRENQVLPLATQIELLWQDGKKDEAKTAFDRLRELSGSLQFGAPAFERLSPIAADLGYPTDWRIPRTPPEDFGPRPELDALGPFRWAPGPAAAWTLKDHEGKSFSLSQYKGQPIIVIFYLGYSCLHCAEQLQKFAPMAEKFKTAGITIVAVSMDDAKGLKMSLENYDGPMPFTLLANEDLDVFKKYRAFDDFEQTPLHGTFLIDGDGQVRWQDIGYEPFMEPEFLLGESLRLLNQTNQPLPTRLAVVDLPERPQPEPEPQPVNVADLPRIDPAGIGGSLVLAGSDLPSEAVDSFLRLSHGEAAKLVVLALDNEPTTKTTTQRLLEQWEQQEGAEFRVLRLQDNDAIQSQDWSTSLSAATGLWLVGSKPESYSAIAQNEPARKALAEFLAAGNVIGSCGKGSEILATPATTPTEAQTENQRENDGSNDALALLPDVIVDTQGASQDSPSQTDAELKRHPYLIAMELDPKAAVIVHHRRIGKVGEGNVRLTRFGSDGEISLSSDRDFADLTALRRAARDAIAGNVAPAQPQPAKVEKGSLIIIGGGGMPKGTIDRFVKLAGGEEAHIVVLPTAMPDPIPERDGMAEAFRRAGAKSVTVLPGRTLDKVESEEYKSALKQATGIWFGGGRQWRFVDAYLDTEAEKLMHNVLERGGVIMGSSAGASIQAEYLARGNPLGNLDIMAAGYERGLGFLPGVAIDQHFSQRNRQGDMVSLVQRYPQLLGIGIDESTALVVQGEVGEVVGPGKVHFYDAKSGGENVKPISVGNDGLFHLPNRKEIVAPQP